MKRWLEDFTPGEELTSHGRTVGEADFLTWAGIDHSYASVHLDDQLMRSTPYGQRIGAGFMTLDLSVGLFGQGDWSFYWPSGALSTESWEDLDFPAAVFIGDTLRCRRVIAGIEPGDDGTGVVVHDVQVINQRDEIVLAGRERIRVRKRDEGAGSGPTHGTAGGHG
ncbi:MAG TPA: MaoC/PaaZ C-terminal domain-containing protein [Acidimicrobiales bacterium]|nr:MaoC/PaaZ C-terminal domain-containing protein [Acidimicrobiales bacterium]